VDHEVRDHPIGCFNEPVQTRIVLLHTSVSEIVAFATGEEF